eukprot:CAMPEP_0177249678 /NCGR_PEP_ID=MMETSP0367-20130122/52904_1 /TAXON_ID=447022 ORGANISM="Scrippsiella hangoei-like, Strain SHHI-4" /NCGR_SAMPLE_ID=MMETSP0367 /ASSEMBLY_ACC=CAM_ASM_000362 /LENGTH=274 /DNA_ID=CAMNT_0018702247 /DNA_START=91 /DNA_END=916 /DNA_ORIENTATION=+
MPTGLERRSLSALRTSCREGINQEVRVVHHYVGAAQPLAAATSRRLRPSAAAGAGFTFAIFAFAARLGAGASSAAAGAGAAFAAAALPLAARLGSGAASSTSSSSAAAATAAAGRLSTAAIPAFGAATRRFGAGSSSKPAFAAGRLGTILAAGLFITATSSTSSSWSSSSSSSSACSSSDAACLLPPRGEGCWAGWPKAAAQPVRALPGRVAVAGLSISGATFGNELHGGLHGILGAPLLVRLLKLPLQRGECGAQGGLFSVQACEPPVERLTL